MHYNFEITFTVSKKSKMWSWIFFQKPNIWMRFWSIFWSCPFLGVERSGCSGTRAITEVCWICLLAKSFSFLISTYSAFKFLRNYLGNFLAFSVRDFFEFHMSDNFQIIFILFGWILFTLLSDWNRSNSIPNRDRKISTTINFFW